MTDRMLYRALSTQCAKRRGGMLAVTTLAACAAPSGCMAVALAPLVPIAGGLMEQQNQVEIDPSMITPELRAAFANSRKLTVLGSEAHVVYMAQHLDEQGDFEVRTAELAKGATPSQRREQLRNVRAVRSPAPDLALSPAAPTSDAGGGSTATALLLGRDRKNLTSQVETLRCSDGKPMRFTIQAKIDQGFYNMDQTQIDQVIGQEAAKALMRLAGKLPDARPK